MRVDTEDDVLRLRAGLRDLVALSGIPAAWIGSEPPAVATGLADALVGLLQLDFAFVRLSDPGGAGAVEVTRGSGWRSFPEWLDGRLAASAGLPRTEVVPDIGDDSPRRRGLAMPVGVNGEGGVVAAASERSDFPTQMDQLLLSLAANHAAVAFQGARLMHERKRAGEELRKARDELELKVAERTAELHLANEELSALRRVATLVAQGVEPVEIFSAVSEEVGRLFGSDLAAVGKFEHDPPANVVVGLTKNVEGVTIGSRWELDESMASAAVYRTGRSARLDGVDWQTVSKPVGAAGRRLGTVCSVSSPIIVEGRLWGTMSVAANEPLPLDAEERQEKFTELLATAIANAEAREALGRLTDEQAALRRVAVLVAEGAPPTAVLDAVAGEMEGLLDADGVTLSRYEPGEETTVVAHRGPNAGRLPPGSRVSHQGENVTSLVRRTERPARREHYEGTHGAIAELVHTFGVRSAVGAPIVVDGRLWGVMIANWSDEHSPPPGTEERMAQFAELLDTAIANADSRDQLTASRARLLTEGDEARRRVVRDLHDGAQQRLVHTIVTLKLAQRQLQDKDGKAESLVGEALEHAEWGNAELRELAHGILPPVLTSGGLRAGIDAVVARLDLPVEVDVPAQRFPAEIEASAYFIVAEALTNVVKHSTATRAEVGASVADGMLQLEVRDDGIGGADPDGHGLVGMGDRVTALGGHLTIESPPGSGTLVAATLPLSAG
jgi:signal transduction histidine kinase